MEAIKATQRSPAPRSRRSPCVELRDLDETSEERDQACEVDSNGKHVWVDLSPWSSQRNQSAKRVKNTTSNTITQFIFFVIKEVSLDVDGRVTVRLPPARALEPTENDCAAHGMQPPKALLSIWFLSDFAPAGRQEKAGTPHLLWSAKIQPVPGS